ncbi:alpha-2-macroglobulin family protein [Methylobrevis pamukkalensis]|uniref:MG2 domain protein n=1 Tax=Methylobrevis pamukkalensis TaxID=1439726 RepID=A0A1E3H0I6_9HYPH|nr:MG2 domain-containing protein [Methylobrevis pamukkalensis]ODN69802.1 MG2 domain protein [Methylobrevis pamukkalensis]
MRAGNILSSLALAATVLLGTVLPGAAAERRIVTTEGADYFGKDFETVKDVGLDGCEAACIADESCKAFTYNTKARWCFLKSSFGDLRAAAGAVAGRIVTGEVAGPDLEARRLAELGFVPQANVDEARRLVGEVAGVPVEGSFDEILAGVDGALAGGETFRALDLLKMALRLAPERFDLWQRFATTATVAESDDWQVRERIRREATAAAIAAYLRAGDDAARASGLAAMSDAFARREVWRPAIKAARASLAVAPDAALASKLDTLVAEHGFRVTENTVDTASASPRICVVLSDTIDATRGEISDFVTVNGGHDLPVEAEGQQICIDGVAYGERYRVTLRPGLASTDGEVLARAADLDIYVRDRDPLVRFIGRAYVLPAGGEATIPVISVNVDTMDARLVRLGDRSLAAAVTGDKFLSQMAGYDVDEIANTSGEAVWTGQIDVTRDLNREVTTAVPVGELVADLKPGVYALSARATTKKDSWSADATQWFIVTDIGLSSLSGNDGLHVVARSLSSAAAVNGAQLRLVAVNNEVLGTATTDGEGYARFDAGLARGTGGSAPALVVAEGPSGDYSFLDLTKSAFDLTDRGVDGRPSPGPVDVFMVTERGVYRPGETVHVTALARDAKATAIADLPLTMIVRRPDGVEQARSLVDDEGLGGRSLALDLSADAMRGSWRVGAYTDPKGTPVAEASFLVEDFVPERLTFDLTPAAPAFDVGAPGSIALEARFLYGAPAAGLDVQGTVNLRPAAGIPGFAGVSFGLAEETFEPQTAYLQSVATDEAGKAELPLAAPDVAATSKPLEARISVQVSDSSGRPVERNVTLPVKGTAGRIGIDPQFDGAVEEGGNARFALVAIDAEGQAVAASGLRWTLSKVDSRFQWYNVDGSWNYEQVKVKSRVADGTIDAATDARPIVEAAVQWGEYVLEVADPSSRLLPASFGFEAGWYVAPSAEDTPDALKVTLDQPKYRVGDTVKARIEARFAGVALVTVVDDRLITMKTVDVPLEGATVELPVTAEWGPGAYVAATLIRPMDLQAKRMPARAIGLAHAGVDPGGRLLDVAISVPDKPSPRAMLPVEVTLANLPAGEEAYVTIAAVDVASSTSRPMRRRRRTAGISASAGSAWRCGTSMAS